MLKLFYSTFLNSEVVGGQRDTKLSVGKYSFKYYILMINWTINQIIDHDHDEPHLSQILILSCHVLLCLVLYVQNTAELPN